MKRAAFVVFVLVLWLATCSAPQPETPAPQLGLTQKDIPATVTAIPPTPMEAMAPAP
jgi:hypothetical protein